MKKNVVLTLFMLIFLVSCKQPVRTDLNMYLEYKLPESILESADIPIVTIETKGSSKIKKKIYTSGNISIKNSPNAFWNFSSIPVSIRGRGNSTWAQRKRPYLLKFNDTQEILGMPEHRYWVLIANYYDNSFLKNTSAFILSEILDMDYTIRGRYVNLVLNGNYVGLYWLGEAIRVGEKRINISEDDFLIEMDNYYDEELEFHSSIKELPCLLKNSDGKSELELNILKEKITNIENVLYSENFPYRDNKKTSYNNEYLKVIDIDSFAKYYLVNEIMHNHELNNPRSCYFSLNNSDNLLKAGPVWDFDWSCYTKSTKLILQNSIYYDALFKTVEFNDRLNSLLETPNLNEKYILEKIDEFRDIIAYSVKLDGERWGTNCRDPKGPAFSSFDEYVDFIEECIITRLNYIKSIDFKTKYNLK